MGMKRKYGSLTNNQQFIKGIYKNQRSISLYEIAFLYMMTQIKL